MVTETMDARDKPHPALPVMLPVVAVATYAVLPCWRWASCVVATSCAAGLAAPGSAISCLLVGAQLGALAYLVAQAARASGAAHTETAATVLGAVCVLIMVAAALQSKKKSAVSHTSK